MQDRTCQRWTWIEGYIDLFEVIESLGKFPGGSVLSQWKQNDWIFFHTFTSTRLVAVDWAREQHMQKLPYALSPQGNACFDLRGIWTGTW